MKLFKFYMSPYFLAPPAKKIVAPAEIIKVQKDGFVKRIIKNTATRKCRCPNTGWWDNFLETHNQIKLYTKCDVDYNIGRLSNYVINTCGNALQTYINIFGIPWLLEQLNSNRKVKDLPAKYRNQIKQYLRDYNDNRRTVERKLPDGEEIIEINEFPNRLENLINELQLNDRGEI